LGRLVSASLDGCLDEHRVQVFVVLDINTGHSNEDRCMPITQRVATLVEREGTPVTLVTGVLVDVLRYFHAFIIDHQVTFVEAQTAVGKMTSHPPITAYADGDEVQIMQVREPTCCRYDCPVVCSPSQ
jgi:hypothetical protein